MARRCRPCAVLPPLCLWLGVAGRVRFYRRCFYGSALPTVCGSTATDTECRLDPDTKFRDRDGPRVHIACGLSRTTTLGRDRLKAHAMQNHIEFYLLVVPGQQASKSASCTRCRASRHPSGPLPPHIIYLFIYYFLSWLGVADRVRFYRHCIYGSALPTVCGSTATVFMARRCRPCAVLPPLILWLGVAGRVRFYRHCVSGSALPTIVWLGGADSVRCDRH